MPKLKIDRSIAIARTPRLRQVEGMFDLSPAKHSHFSLEADLPLDERPWQIGLIVGASGCGKSTLARQLFGKDLVAGFEWPKTKSIIDGFPASASIQEITGLLSSVGFSSPPAWCRPFHVLSNGEQFRVTIARALCEAIAAGQETPIAVDEFTSVVDRTVARIGSAAVAKAIRARPGLRFVAIGCHYDVVEWLQPDWIFEPARGAFAWRRLRRRPEIAVEIMRASPDVWPIFRRHHYLSSALGSAARCFVGLVEGQPAVFTAVTSFPHPIRPSFREHRTVCLPDFQGVGLGNAMSEFVGSVMLTTGKPYRSVTSHPAMIRHRMNSPLWRVVRKKGLLFDYSRGLENGFESQTFADGRMRSEQLLRTASISRATASFEFIGPSRPDLAWILGGDAPIAGSALGDRLEERIRARARTMKQLVEEFDYSSTRIGQLLQEIRAKRFGKPARYFL